MQPKKHLGQNFLTSIPARIAIVNAGALTAADTVLEIGPGKGFLTKGLLETGAKVIALEKDKELIPVLAETFAKEIRNGQLTIICEDALEFNFKQFGVYTTKYKLIANIPYYITGAILEKYLSQKHKPESMVVLVQKEVAQRIASKDGKESILSLSVKAYGDPKIVYKVNRGSFYPIPAVDSAVLSVQNIDAKHFKNKKHEEYFFEVVKAGFAHKRKFLISNLREKFPSVDFQKLFNAQNISEKVRAERVSLQQWLTLAEKLSLS
jgi:16S rRNA (adenine1518-N6/adenine1519-N6)-dimethyltransferase